MTASCNYISQTGSHEANMQGDMWRTVRSVLRAAFTARYFQPNTLRKASGMDAAELLKMYHITMFEGHWLHVKCKSFSRWLARELRNTHLGGWHTVHLTQISRGGPINLTWNLNQEGRFLFDPPEKVTAAWAYNEAGMQTGLPSADRIEGVRVRLDLRCIHGGWWWSVVQYTDMISCLEICSAFMVMLPGYSAAMMELETDQCLFSDFHPHTV